MSPTKDIKYYTPEMAGEGQRGLCVKCKKPPVFDTTFAKAYQVYDACLGKLPDNDIMNACCGHGNDKKAYVQRWTKRKLMGQEAIEFIKTLRAL